MAVIRSKNTSDRIVRYAIYIISAIILFGAAYPLYFVVIASFSNPADVTNGKVWLFPMRVSLEGYMKVFEHEPLWIGYRNTIFYTISFTLLSLCVTIPSAYALSRKDLMLRNPIMFIFTVPMFFGGGLIPTYLVIKSLNLLDNPLVMILPGCLGIYNMIISRTFFQNNISSDLREAAFIDGSGEARFFFTMALPLSKAIISVIALYCAEATWNSYFNGLIYLKSANLKPLQLVLRDILIANDFNARQGSSASASMASQALLKELIKYCTIVVSTLPMMIVYPFIQKHFTQGVMIGAIKG